RAPFFPLPRNESTAWSSRHQLFSAAGVSSKPRVSELCGPGYRDTVTTFTDDHSIQAPPTPGVKHVISQAPARLMAKDRNPS
ncbi:hypothetical protein BaRGS_00034583, partial [Batillaria attramentaria]